MRLIALIAALALVPAIALAATPKGGSWSGDTRQNKSISFKVDNGKVKKLKVGWKASCGGAKLDSQTTFGGKYAVTDGKFTAKSTNGTVKGTFTSKRKAKGTLRFKQQVFTGFGYESCDSGKVRWTAKR